MLCRGRKNLSVPLLVKVASNADSPVQYDYIHVTHNNLNCIQIPLAAVLQYSN